MTEWKSPREYSVDIQIEAVVEEHDAEEDGDSEIAVEDGGWWIAINVLEPVQRVDMMRGEKDGWNLDSFCNFT